MKRTAVLLAVLLCAAAFARGGGGGRPPAVRESSDIAVFVTGGLNESEKTILASWALNALVRSGRFTAAERWPEFAAEAGKAQVTRSDGSVDDGYIGRIGKQFGIRNVCVVGVASYSGYYTVSARVLDAETGKIKTFGRAHGQLNSTQALEALSIDVVIAMGIGWSEPAPPSEAADAQASQPQHPTAAPSPQPQPVASAPQPSPQPQTAASAPPPPQQQPVASAPPPSPPPAAFAPPAVSEPPPAAVETQPPLSLEDVGASVIIHSKPPEADVYIGGRFIGKTNQPDKLLMPIGTYEVKFVKDDAEKTETMTFEPGENSTKVVQLDDGKQNKKSKPKVKAD